MVLIKELNTNYNSKKYANESIGFNRARRQEQQSQRGISF